MSYEDAFLNKAPKIEEAPQDYTEMDPTELRSLREQLGTEAANLRVESDSLQFDTANDEATTFGRRETAQGSDNRRRKEDIASRLKEIDIEEKKINDALQKKYKEGITK